MGVKIIYKLEDSAYLWLKIWMKQHIAIGVNCKVITIWTQLRRENVVLRYIVMAVVLNEFFKKPFSNFAQMIMLLNVG